MARSDEFGTPVEIEVPLTHVGTPAHIARGTSRSDNGSPPDDDDAPTDRAVGSPTVGSPAARSSSGGASTATRIVTITNPDKVMFPSVGPDKEDRTKLDLARYYLSVGEPVIATLLDRAVLLERYPNGVRGKSFFQKRIPDSAPDWLTTTTVQTINGTPSRALVISDLAHVLWAANQGVLGLHVWQFRASEPDDADEMRIDLDPSPGVTFDMTREAAGHTRDLLAELGMVGFAKTTGSKGIHIYVRVEPGWDSFAVRGAVVAIGRILSERHPDLITDKWWKEERGERVFVDFNQNAPHKNMFGAWGVRPRVGAQVSTPFRWDELDSIDPEACTIDTVPGRLETEGDPWELMDDAPCSIAPLVERFASDLANGVPDAPWPPQYPKMPNEAPRVQPSRARSTPDTSPDTDATTPLT